MYDVRADFRYKFLSIAPTGSCPQARFRSGLSSLIAGAL
jgi:hypothetical protein